ncbi:MAG: competence type IV pilus major pilin ComGC [Bacillota bacterium]|uniref:ComG operon protein 3 n=1 Tax=Virgibacillus salarius TaxID=447199 RepID=A0A941DVZ5_9BACI|nr:MULTISPECIES: competence type IV pilus major pilin ComGC [Bacillaceae]NAZ10505.1 prepilin-type N-terminal cleavage/methylation domain-containing protein [Agaribacter marinus]MBR7797795.1 prepilin-type N-terminal cleavage/methylation domain-containing protein [Virgibacillus salarius]MCC2252120.1 prepilin-type N-terminal cleavage/methylation domain-containing protein [Virgibacillus sp. AGTR]MDY7046115.1 competence type IV pilus major pilin ComGC [Virgibacillus sp. M23]QRZ17397.1 prepilin-type
MPSDNKGFTLIEMLIVLMIISVLIILIVPNLSEKSKDVNSKGCKALVAVVQAQVDTVYAESGIYPTSLDAMVPKYIKEEQKSCSNKTPLNYNRETGKVSVPAT